MKTDLLKIGSMGGIFRPFQASPKNLADLEKDIGRAVRYILPAKQEARARFIHKHGTLCVEAFEIIGVQKNWKGDACYRIKCLAYSDRVGTPVSPDMVYFVDGGK